MSVFLENNLTQRLYVVLVALWIPMAAVADVTNETNQIIVPASKVRQLLRANDLRECQKLVDLWKRALPYQKLGLAEELVSQLKNVGSSPLRGYDISKDGGNDMTMVAGRAKWAFEQIMDVQLADLKRSTAIDSLVALQSNAVALVDARRSDLMSEGSKEIKPGLAEKYKGKIIPGISEASSGNTAVMLDLLAEWQPIGKRFEDLAAIIGSRGRNTKDKDVVMYAFEDGSAGCAFQFSVKEGIITSVKALWID
ncbi:MAG: hypothetical protein WCN95_16355 [bacterium]